jgi:hypothetical protein
VYSDSSVTIPLIRTLYAAGEQVLDLDQKNVAPRTMVDFRLTDCNEMQGYIIGFFDGGGN